MELKLDTIYTGVLLTNEELKEYINKTYGEMLNFRRLKSYKEYVSKFETTYFLFSDCEDQFEDKKHLIALIMCSSRIQSEFLFDESELTIRLVLKIEIDRKEKKLYFDELNRFQIKHILTFCIIEIIKLDRDWTNNEVFIKGQESKHLEYIFNQTIIKSKQKYFTLIEKI